MLYVFIYVLGIVCMKEVMQEGKSYRNNSLLAFSKPSFSLIGIATGTSAQVRLGEGGMEEKLINIRWMNNQSRDF